MFFIRKNLDLSLKNINYISFILYNDFPDLSNYLNENYYNKEQHNIIEQKINPFYNHANGNLIHIESAIQINKIYNHNIQYSTILKYTYYTDLEHHKRINVKDNIYIEFLNGICINQFKKKSPNWIKTYSCILFDKYYTNTNILDNIREKINNTDIKTNFFEDICKKKYNSAIFIEKLEDSITFNDFLNKHIIKNDIFNNLTDKILSIQNEIYFNNFIMDCYGILIQVYSALKLNDDKFTHQDLHLHNILLTKDPSNKKFTFIYNYGNKQIKIHTNYIAVIIDYGKTYVGCTNASTNIFQKNAYEAESCVDPYRYHDLPDVPILNSKINFAQYNKYYNHSLNNQKDFSTDEIDLNIHSIDNRCIYLFRNLIDEAINANNRKLVFNNKKVTDFLNNVFDIKTKKEFKNITDTLEWLIDCFEKSNITVPIKNDLVDFNINIDMYDNRDWYVDFL